jgi:hypothetical protein
MGMSFIDYRDVGYGKVGLSGTPEKVFQDIPRAHIF